MQARPSFLIAVAAGMLAVAPVAVAVATSTSSPAAASAAPATRLVSQTRPYPAYLAIDLRGITQLLPSPPPPPKPVVRVIAAPVVKAPVAPAAPVVRAAAVAGLIWPVHGPIMSPFGARSGRMHEGDDIGSPIGTPVLAPLDGQVTYAGTMSGYGNLIEIRHANGMSTRYGHLSRMDVRVGQTVGQGQVIGAVGMTGNSSAPHLHFEVRIGGVPHNPLDYLP